jgi:hypothetical protein
LWKSEEERVEEVDEVEARGAERSKGVTLND